MLATVEALCSTAGLTSPALLEVVRGHMPTITKFFRLPPLVLVVLAALAASLIMMAVVLASPAQAASLTVTTSADEPNTDGNCSLREAIEAANTNAAVDGCAAGSDTALDTIVFSVGQEATISLGSELPITDDAGLTINGQQNEITISGNDASRVIQVDPGAVFNLRNLTVADGNSAGDIGGGILNGGTLTVTRSTFSNNNADSPNGGSGIYNDGSLEVTNSTFSGNGTSGGGDGGGITNASFRTLTVTGSTFSGNSTTGNGGGIQNFGGGELTVTNSTFSGNGADGVGGAILNQGGTLTVTNSTFSGNGAGGVGGGAIYVEGSGNTLKNTIVANSTQGGNCFLGFDGAITDGGYNVEDADTCGFSAANNSQPSTEPRLDALADNGGPTQTHALKQASPAINAIPSATNGCGTDLTTDQRGIERPQGGNCEIGSFEDSSPKVTSVVPLKDATGVSPSTNVSAFFSEAMRANSINVDSVKLFKAGTTAKIAAQVSYGATAKRALLNPSANLELGTRYKAVVTAGVTDLPGNRLDQDQDPSNGLQQKVWFFRVRN